MRLMTGLFSHHYSLTREKYLVDNIQLNVWALRVYYLTTSVLFGSGRLIFVVIFLNNNAFYKEYLPVFGILYLIFLF